MKLASFRVQGDSRVRVGALATIDGAAWLVDLPLAYGHYLEVSGRDGLAYEVAAARLPADMTRLLQGGERSLEAARLALDHAATVDDRAHLAHRGALHALDSVQLLAPVPRPSKIISVGANYQSHLDEVRRAGFTMNVDTPVAFAKVPSTLIGHEAPIVYPRHTQRLDYELEMGLIIGRRCKDVPAEHWLDVVVGFTICNDVSLRDIQFREMKNGIMFEGKNLDTCCPMGPFLVTKDEIADPQALDLELRVNGQVRQRDNTRNMLFPCADLVAYWSRMTLEPGDMFTTGSPAGVAFIRPAPERFFLQPGDVVECEIQSLGLLRNPVVAEGAASTPASASAE